MIFSDGHLLGESGIANEAMLGDILLKTQNHDAKRASVAHQRTPLPSYTSPSLNIPAGPTG